MIISPREFTVNGLAYTIRSAAGRDAEELSRLRVSIDGETENMDREPGEAFIDAAGFGRIIEADSASSSNLILVAETNSGLIGYSRCEGSCLKRLAHKVEFGVCVLKHYWGHGIGSNLLGESIAWADSGSIRKMVLYVLETNENAIKLYRKHGFEVEGILINDKLLADGNYYNTVVMGRFKA